MSEQSSKGARAGDRGASFLIPVSGDEKLETDGGVNFAAQKAVNDLGGFVVVGFDSSMVEHQASNLT